MENEGLAARLEQLTRHWVPPGLVILCMLIAVLPGIMPYWSDVAPALALIPLYYWSIYRPDLIGMTSAFLLGVLQDMLTGVPLGVNALLFVLIQAVVSGQRRFFLAKPFFVAWWGFAMVIAVALPIKYLLVAMLYGDFTPLSNLVFHMLLTAAMFPPVGWVCARTQMALLQDE